MVAAKEAKEPKEKPVKGEEAEELVLQYLKQVNRPYAAADVSANLQNKVTKAACQKVLTALAEKGSLTVKAYGKQSIFVYPQGELPKPSAEDMSELDGKIKALGGEVDEAKKVLKRLEHDVTQKTSLPKTADIPAMLAKIEQEHAVLLTRLAPLREQAAKLEKDAADAGQAGGPSKAEDVAALDGDWAKWRKEWVARKRVYSSLLDNMKSDCSASDRAAFEEEIGVEPDTEECIALQASALCSAAQPAARGIKRKAVAAPKTAKPAPASSGKKVKAK